MHFNTLYGLMLQALLMEQIRMPHVRVCMQAYVRFNTLYGLMLHAHRIERIRIKCFIWLSVSVTLKQLHEEYLSDLMLSRVWEYSVLWTKQNGPPFDITLYELFAWKCWHSLSLLCQLKELTGTFIINLWAYLCTHIPIKKSVLFVYGFMPSNACLYVEFSFLIFFFFGGGRSFSHI